MSEIHDLEQERGVLITNAQKALTEARGRDMTAEEEKNWQEAIDASDKLKERIERLARQEELSKEMSAVTERKAKIQTDENRDAKPEGKVEHRELMRQWALGGNEVLTVEQRTALGVSNAKVEGKQGNSMTINLMWSHDLPELVSRGGSSGSYSFPRGWAKEHRAAQTVTTTGGGDVIQNEDMVALEEALLQFGGMRQSGASVLRTSTGATLPLPTVDDTGVTGALLAINIAASEAAFTFGQVTLGAYKYTSGLVLVPIELMQDSSFDFASFVTRNLGTRIGRILNTHFTAGTGSGQPNGVKNVANGAVTTVASATAITGNNLIDLQDTLDQAYDPNARWMWKKSTGTAIRKLTDAGSNNYLWQPGFQAGEPDQLLGKPFTVNQDMRSIAADKRSVLYGDFSKYFIRDVLGITVLRLDERYAEKAQVGFVAFSRHDGDIVDAGTNPILALRHPAS